MALEQFNDAKYDRLGLSGYTDSDHITEREQQWLKAATGWEAGDSQQINDLWGVFLEGRGYSGQINEMLYQYLGDNGYDDTDHIQDRLSAFWGEKTQLPGPLP